MILMSNGRPKEVYGTEKITATKQTPAGTYKDVRKETKTTKEITINHRDQESTRNLSWARRNQS